MLALLLLHRVLLQLLLRTLIASTRGGQTATMPVLLLTSYSTIGGSNAIADASVARIAVLTAVILRMLLLHIQKV